MSNKKAFFSIIILSAVLSFIQHFDILRSHSYGVWVDAIIAINIVLFLSMVGTIKLKSRIQSFSMFVVAIIATSTNHHLGNIYSFTKDYDLALSTAFGVIAFETFAIIALIGYFVPQEEKNMQEA
jgi:hypothetical protein